MWKSSVHQRYALTTQARVLQAMFFSPLIYLHRHLPAREHGPQMEMYRALRPSPEPLSTPMFPAVCYSFCNPPRRSSPPPHPPTDPHTGLLNHYRTKDSNKNDKPPSFLGVPQSHRHKRISITFPAGNVSPVILGGIIFH